MKNSPVRTVRATVMLAVLLTLATSLPGCVSIGAKPWDRDLLATRPMQLNTLPLVTAFRDHVYFSKEGSSGGRTFDGGGCGCN